jgi:hypothetical protein
MHSDTQRGIGPYLAAFPTPDPVFPLSRKRAAHSWPDERPRSIAVALDPRTGLPAAWPFADELDPRDPRHWNDDDDDDDVHEHWARWRSPRSVAVRVIGSLTLFAALFGCGVVLAHPEARREALDWVSLGHPALVVGIAHDVASAVRQLGPEG